MFDTCVSVLLDGFATSGLIQPVLAVFGLFRSTEEVVMEGGRCGHLGIRAIVVTAALDSSNTRPVAGAA